MRSVNIAELKNRLSTYLSYAKSGEEVVIRDRNLPVAKLVPFVAENATEEELILVAQGKLKLAEKQFDPDEFWKNKSTVGTEKITLQDIIDAVAEDREDRF